MNKFQKFVFIFVGSVGYMAGNCHGMAMGLAIFSAIGIVMEIATA